MLDTLLSWRPSTWLDYLYIYLMPGAGMAIFFVVNILKDRPSASARDLLKAVGRETNLADQIKELAVYSLALLCVLIGWPGFVIWLILDKKKEAALQRWENRPDFACAPDYLVAKVDPLDAEITSYVIDPLGHVPSIPFGHLNKAWGIFLTEIVDKEGELWSFHIPKGSKSGKYQMPCTSEMRGFAQVRAGKIIGEFITESD